MPETDEREESEKLPQESADIHMSGSGKDEPDAPAAENQAPSGAKTVAEPSIDAPDLHAAEPKGGSDLGEFADNVVSGLEAALSAHEEEAADPQAAGDKTDLAQMTDTYFAGWGGSDTAESGDGAREADAAPLDLQAVTLTSLASSSGWNLPGGAAEPEEDLAALDKFAGPDSISLSSLQDAESLEQMDSGDLAGVEFRDLSELPEIALDSWGASEGFAQEEPALKFGLESQSLASLGGSAGLASAPSSSSFQDAPDDVSKREELADAVQSALMSIYGQQSARTAESPSQKRAAVAGDDPSSLVWNKGPTPDSGNPSPQEVILNYFDYQPEDEAPQAAEPAFASSSDDARTAQEVILDYFDYEGAPGGKRPQQADYGLPREREQEEPITLRQQAEPVVPFRRPPQVEERPIQRSEWEGAAAHAPQYSAPQSLPVPAAAPAAEQKPQAAAAQESSRLLGAAAIGLMGGIAIAASLAAFLIYGPHPSTVEIPGFGSLRIDRDEQGYVPALADEGAKEAPRNQVARAPEYSGEVFAADAIAVPGQPSPLSINVRSQLPSEKLLVSITGVPEGGRLSAGVEAEAGNWLVAPWRLAGLAISLPSGSPNVISLEAQILDSNTRAPLSQKGAFSVRLASAAPDAGQTAPAIAPRQPSQPNPSAGFSPQTTVATQPAADAAPAASQPTVNASFKTQTVAAAPPQKAAVVAPVITAPAIQAAPPAQASLPRRTAPRPEVEDLIREGNKRMREGDILEARQFYQKAVAFGDPEAALAMGRSYDPIYFARIEKKNAEPDAAKAFEWYKRAMDSGASQTAMVRIENLKHFLNE